jgi:uncharacterized protein (TIGR03437 family)
MGLAPGEIVAIAGSGLGPSQEIRAQFGPDGRLAGSLAGVRLTFDGIPAPLLSVQAEKVVCIVPFGLKPPGSATTVQAHFQNRESNGILLPVWWSSIETLAAAKADGSPTSKDHPAAPGSLVTVYGAGFGPMLSPTIDGQINTAGNGQFATGSIGVKVGDQDAQVLYAGPAPGQVAGIVQINFRLPQLPPGSYLAFVGWNNLPLGDYHAIPVWAGQP